MTTGASSVVLKQRWRQRRTRAAAAEGAGAAGAHIQHYRQQPVRRPVAIARRPPVPFPISRQPPLSPCPPGRISVLFVEVAREDIFNGLPSVFGPQSQRR
uniref:Uncharacterized protein n=1 Tax=Oryza nivara TaxID=4536 RepID=A0A0E0H5E6_ORYNI